MTARRRPSSYRPLPSRTAAVWLWLDILAKIAKLPPLAQVFVLAIAAMIAVTVIAWWPIFVAALICLALIKLYSRHHTKTRRTRGGIPFGGRLSPIEWACCKIIGACEALLYRHNRRRPS